MAATCPGQTKSGAACGMSPQANGWCYSHDPAREQERIAARRRGGRHRKRRTVAALDAGSVDVSNVAGIQRVLAAALADALRIDVGVQRTRAVASLCSVALAALDRVPPGELDTEALRAAFAEMLRRDGLDRPAPECEPMPMPEADPPAPDASDVQRQQAEQRVRERYGQQVERLSLADLRALVDAELCATFESVLRTRK